MSEQRKIVEEGSRKARLCKYIIAGKHMVEGYQGAPDKEKPMVIVAWEMSEDFRDDGKNLYMKGFDLGQIADFDTDKSKKTEWFTGMFEDYIPGKSKAQDFLGRGCRLVVEHKQSKAGNTYARLVKTRDYEGELPELKCNATFFDFYNPDAEQLKFVADWEVEYMQQAIDYPGSKLQALLEGDTQEVVSDEPSF